MQARVGQVLRMLARVIAREWYRYYTVMHTNFHQVLIVGDVPDRKIPIVWI